MAAKLYGEKRLKREIRIYGVEVPCIVTLSAQGVKVQVAGTKIFVDQTWPELVKTMCTPGNCPSFLAGRAYELLQHQAVKRRKKLAK